MAFVNENYMKLKAGYLFPEISRRIKLYSAEHPDARIIRLGIGDVTQPLSSAIIKAFHDGVEDLATAERFKGYGPEQGYGFLIDVLRAKAFAPLGVSLEQDEIFISDGSKPDCANILDIFGAGNKIGVADPVYPVYVDTNVMAGHTGEVDEAGHYAGLVYMPCVAEQGFVPQVPKEKLDIVYLCFPNNPTGAVATREQLKAWVDYALANDSVLLFDAAYEAFITTPGIPHSIYEIDGAKKCAIEFRSFSKTAGFTGVRCGVTVVPRAVMAKTKSGEPVSLNKMWTRRQTTKFNGASYPVQCAAAAVYSDEGWAQVRQVLAYYQENARIIREGLSQAGLTVYGGLNAPYIWLKTPQGLSSWDFFDLLLDRCCVVGTPGSGFGPGGEGYFRLSALGARADAQEALSRIVTAGF